jgi:hypothetical protein
MRGLCCRLAISNAFTIWNVMRGGPVSNVVVCPILRLGYRETWSVQGTDVLVSVRAGLAPLPWSHMFQCEWR